MSGTLQRLVVLLALGVILGATGCRPYLTDFLVPDMTATAVPNVLGMTGAAAERALARAELSADESTATVQIADYVILQSPPGGAASTKGDRVALSTISLAAHGEASPNQRTAWIDHDHGLIALRNGAARCLRCHLVPGERRRFCNTCHPKSSFDQLSEYPFDAYRD